MTQQAKNCLELYHGGSPATIKKLLQSQKISVLKGLQNYFATSELDKLAVCLSNGK